MHGSASKSVGTVSIMHKTARRVVSAQESMLGLCFLGQRPAAQNVWAHCTLQHAAAVPHTR